VLGIGGEQGVRQRARPDAAMDDSEGRAGTSWRREATSCGYGGEGRIGTTGMCDATKWRGNKKVTKCWCRWGLEGGGVFSRFWLQVREV
jgi:hypothetical protein